MWVESVDLKVEFFVGLTLIVFLVGGQIFGGFVRGRRRQGQEGGVVVVGLFFVFQRFGFGYNYCYCVQNLGYRWKEMSWVLVVDSIVLFLLGY